MFDARAYYASLEAPKFIDPNGREHTGRIIGTDTWSRLQVKLREAKSDGQKTGKEFDVEGLNQALALITDATFPPKPWYKRLFRREKSVKDWIWELPEIGRMRAVWDFIRSQAKARGMELAPTLGTQSLEILPTDKQDGLLDVAPTSGS